MNWIPQFLNWPMAALAGAIVVPSLLILYFLKLRRLINEPEAGPASRV